MKKPMFFLVLLCLLLTGCATHDVVTTVPNGFGFWTGLWHGMTAPLSLIGHLFNSHIQIYQTPNNGGWYDFGFLIGIGSYRIAL